MRGGSATSAEEVRTYRNLRERIDARLMAEGVSHEVLEYVRGNTPAEDICAVASQRDAALIVIGYRRRTPAGKALLGSDAQEILLSAPCPVLAVRESGEPAG